MSSNQKLQQAGKWTLRFLGMAQLVGTWSKDPSTKTGCVIARGNRLVSVGFNGYPSGIVDSLDDERDVKLSKTIHAEVNAIMHAPNGVKGCRLYVTPIPPCDRCGALIIQAGISEVIVGLQHDMDLARWQQFIDMAQDMFDEADIRVRRWYFD